MIAPWNEPLPELDAALQKALSAFAEQQKILVALDFDGTMSPLVDRPEDARPLPESAEAFEVLSRLPGVSTGVISGRNLASLAQVYPAPLPQICVGSHGAERRIPASTGVAWEAQELSVEQQQLLVQLTGRLQEVAARHVNVNLEYKPSATVLHVRQASPDVANAALQEAREALASLEGLKLLEGKAVLEVSVLHGDKGQSLQWLRDVLGVDAVLFIGDDVTDENGFKVLENGDLGIKVGAGQTAAQHRIASPQQLPDLLKSLISMRQ